MPAIYQADVWCDSCADQIRTVWQEYKPKNPDDETSYDSYEWPKYMPEDEESDSPQHCASGPDCLESELIPSVSGNSCRAGKLLSTSLTQAGVDYVREVIIDGGDLAEWWRAQFEAAGYDFNLPD